MFPQLFGKYVLEREIAAGGMARVYLATLRGAVGFEKRLVVKQIRPELASDDAFVRRFVEEAKTAVELGHPNIVPVYELGVEQGIYYIAMEHCEGATLAEVLAETGSLSPEEGAYVGTEICRALDYSHRRAGVVHRDVTPRNVMLDEEGAVRVIDFGIAAPVTLDDDGRDRHEVFGSPGHMPPEQIGGGSLTPATDVFAVAVLLTEAWTGLPPFRRATVGECRAALGVKPPSIAEARPELAPLAELMAASMSLDPELRPQTAEALARPLREFVKSADLGDLARRLGARVRRTRRKLLASAPWLLSSDDDREVPPAEAIPATETKPRAPSIGDTQTFAVRDDMVEWTRKLPSVAPPPDDGVVGSTASVTATPSTRRLEGTEDRNADVAGSTPDSEADVAGSTPDSEAAEAADGVATSGERGTRGARSSRAWLAIPALLAAVGLGWWGARSTLPGRPLPSAGAATQVGPLPPPSTSAAPTPSVGTSASATPTSSSPAPVPVLPPPSAPSARAGWVPSGSAPTPPPAGSDPTTPAGKATLSLTANPPSSVSVAGKSYGTTPVMGLSLPAGSYSVSFENPTLGLRTGARVTLAPGGRRAVHADFTLATPSVSVR